MKSVVSISAAMLLAMSLTACGNNDEQDNAAASNGEAPETNTASQNSNAMESSGGSQTSGDTQDDMAAQPATDESSMGDSANANAQAGSSASAMGSGSSEDMPQAAIAVLHGTDGNDGVSATIRFTPQGSGLAYTTEAEGLAPGSHGYHIHLYGDCSSGDGKSAGTHYNLKGSSKNPPKDIDRITGDLGNLEAGEDGSASDEGMIDGASLTGAKAIIGRGVIIHAKANDPSQPPIGAAGSRQACGVIGIAEAETDAANAGDASASADTSMDSGASSEADEASQMAEPESGSQAAMDDEQSGAAN